MKHSITATPHLLDDGTSPSVKFPSTFGKPPFDVQVPSHLAPVPWIHNSTCPVNDVHWLFGHPPVGLESFSVRPAAAPWRLCRVTAWSLGCCSVGRCRHGTSLTRQLGMVGQITNSHGLMEILKLEKNQDKINRVKGEIRFCFDRQYDDQTEL